MNDYSNPLSHLMTAMAPDAEVKPAEETQIPADAVAAAPAPTPAEVQPITEPQLTERFSPMQFAEPQLSSVEPEFQQPAIPAPQMPAWQPEPEVAQSESVQQYEANPYLSAHAPVAAETQEWLPQATSAPSWQPETAPAFLSTPIQVKPAEAESVQQEAYQEPVYQTPVPQEPAYQAPIQPEPVYQEPIYQEPVSQQSIQQARPEPYIESTPSPQAAAARAASMPVASDYKQIVIEHGQWLASEGKEGKRANFRGFDLTGVDLSGQSLMEASFRNTILTGANLSGADLRAADLSEAILDDANLANALLTGATLARTQLHRTVLANADMVTANLSAVIAESINLSNAKLNGAILRDANLRHAELSHAILRDANLRGASVVEANLLGADLSAADCRDVNFDRSVFTGAILDGTNLRGAKLGDVDLQSADFSKTLDLSSEIQTQSMQSERIKLQEEQAQLASWRTAIEAREQSLADDRRQMEEQMEAFTASQAETANKIGKYATGFMLRFVFWLVVVLAIVGFTAYRMLEVGDEFGIDTMIICGTMLIVLLVALLSMMRSYKVAKLLKAQPVVSLSNLGTGNTETFNEPKMAATPSLNRAAAAIKSQPQAKPKGFGFGKKK